jgi:hypothetical protein
VRFFRHHKPEIGFTHPALNYTLTDQEGSFNKNDIFIGYKGFLCFYDQARLLEIGVDSIAALA